MKANGLGMYGEESESESGGNLSKKDVEILKKKIAEEQERCPDGVVVDPELKRMLKEKRRLNQERKDKYK